MGDRAEFEVIHRPFEFQNFCLMCLVSCIFINDSSLSFRLEQVSSDERVGSLAENLMEAIRKNPSVAQKIEEVRKQTKDEKKRLAMAMREKQLGALGMSTNEKGQVSNFLKIKLDQICNDKKTLLII